MKGQNTLKLLVDTRNRVKNDLKLKVQYIATDVHAAEVFTKGLYQSSLDFKALWA